MVTVGRIPGWAAVLAAGVLAVGCSLIPPQPVPLVPFGDFSVTTTGGVAGIYRQLRVSADGVALVLSDRPAAGRVDRPRMDRLRTLLESAELRRDVARLRDDRSGSRCSDAFQTTLRMGDLVASGTDTCGLVPTPALDELDEILRPLWDGDFEQPLPDGPAPPRIVLREVRAGEPTANRIELESGRATRVVDGTDVEARELQQRQTDALRLLAMAPRCRPERELGDGYVVEVGGWSTTRPVGARSGPECPELNSIVAIGLAAVGR